MNIGIAGAGLLGRLLAWQLAGQGHAVTVFDPAEGPQAPPTGQLQPGQPYAAGFTAAGMLSPLAELDNAGPEVATLGWRSLALWRDIAQALGRPELLRQHGSLLLAHGSDLGAAQRVLARLAEAPGLATPQPLDREALLALEPALAPMLKAWLLPGEGQVLPREMLEALCAASPSVAWRWGTRVAEVAPGRLLLSDGGVQRVDLAIDTRGIGAKATLGGCGESLGWTPQLRGESLGWTPQLRGESLGWTPQLRGVRGEILWLHAPGVSLTRPLRLLHPRHRVYLLPRPGDLIVVGASEVESEDRSPVSLRSAVELMAAAHSLLPELAEARIVHMEANLRPALPDHLPRSHIEPGLLRINGLFRHGWLLAPALVQDALTALNLKEMADAV